MFFEVLTRRSVVLPLAVAAVLVLEMLTGTPGVALISLLQTLTDAPRWYHGGLAALFLLYGVVALVLMLRRPADPQENS